MALLLTKTIDTSSEVDVDIHIDELGLRQFLSDQLEREFPSMPTRQIAAAVVRLLRSYPREWLIVED